MEINPVSDIRIQPDSVVRSSAGRNPSFEGAFQAEVAAAGGMRFSNHAQQRLDARNIQLTQQDVARIARSTDDAMAKGAKESLVLMGRLALIVGVPNRTVITVMEPHERANMVFTNIDSVVVVAKDEPSS